MRGYAHYNFPAFDLAAAEMRREGWHVVSPADIDRLFEPWPDKYPPEDFEPTVDDFKRFIRRDLNFLLELSPETDGIYMLSGWEKSKGAVLELAMAEFIGLKVIYEEDNHVE
jgi:hypothetical protein